MSIKNNGKKKKDGNKMKTERKKIEKTATQTPKEIAKICLECPFPVCNGLRCQRYKEEKRKIESTLSKRTAINDNDGRKENKI